MEQLTGNGESQETDNFHFGRYFLSDYGHGHSLDTVITLKDGKTIIAEDFLDVCGEAAFTALDEVDQMDPNDPDYIAKRGANAEMMQRFMGEPPVIA